MSCLICRGPVSDGYARCYQCDLAARQAAGLLADAVAPVGYAVRGGRLAADLWRYKSQRADAAESVTRLRAALAAFLADHGAALWRAAGMPDGPSAVAIVPSGQGRPGRHPLLGIVGACVSLPLIPLSIAPEGAAHVRGVDPGWLRVGVPVAGTDVLVIDDTWVSGGSAQSASAALKLAGARRVAVVVIGRHVNPADPQTAKLVSTLHVVPRQMSPGRPDTSPSPGQPAP